MVRNNYLRLTSCVFIASLVLTGCAESGGPDQLPEATVGGSELPEGQLGNAVVPTRYQLELKIDPTQERFSGVVAIDVTVNEARDEIWLHGKHLDVSEVYLIDGDMDVRNQAVRTSCRRQQSAVLSCPKDSLAMPWCQLAIN